MTQAEAIFYSPTTNLLFSHSVVLRYHSAFAGTRQVLDNNMQQHRPSKTQEVTQQSK